jgi:uncharacterized protein YqiB (DUF1249 family)
MPRAKLARVLISNAPGNCEKSLCYIQSMLGDDLCAVSWRARPGSFVGLMTLYESNYIRLGWLAGDLRGLVGEHRSRVATDVELKLTVLERGPYTTMLQLTYSFGGDAEWPDAPDLALRVYHDARVAEAHAFGAAASKAAGRLPVDGGDLGSRWARNVMLNKWLEYCVDRGHRFGRASG